jgi:8-oxo-dGTP pyrophosphatase MutT (NUDIX family)
MDDFSLSMLKNKKFKMMSLKPAQLKEFMQILEHKLAGPKPGLEAQLTMVTKPRPGHQVYHEMEASGKKAGVLVLLYPREDRLNLILTRRTERVDYHKGQISFPGGRQEKGETLEQTAEREAHEELGIDPHSIHLLGRLTPLYIPPSNYCIYPVVAFSESRPNFRPFRLEVAEVLEVPLDLLLDSHTIQREKRRIRGIEIEVPFYACGEHKIWGATAMVLAELLKILSSLRGFVLEQS